MTKGPLFVMYIF